MFYPLTFGLAAAWITRQPGLRAAASRATSCSATSCGDRSSRRSWSGLLLAGIFVAGGFVIRYIPPLASLTEDVLGYARLGICRWSP